MNIQSVNTISPALNVPRSAATDTAPNAKEATTTAALASSQAHRTAASVKPADELKPSDEQLQSAVKAANDFIQPFNGSLQFSIDKDTGTTVVKVIDTKTNEVIKQFPSEEMLAIAKSLDQLKGVLVRQKA